MLQVLCPTLVEDVDVVQIYNHERVGEMSQYVIHQPHKSYRGIFETKGHDQLLKESLFGFEGGLRYICGFYMNLVIARIWINHAEELGPFELVDNIINLWDWVFDPDNDLISFQ